MLAPLLFLGTFELVLRVFRFGYEPGFFVAANDRRLDAVYEHLRMNVAEIARLGGNSGAEVLIGTCGC